MPVCLNKSVYPKYDFKKEQEDALRKLDDKVPSVSTYSSIAESTPTVDPCVDAVYRRQTFKQLFQKWERLKRVNDLYNEQVTKLKSDAFKNRILRHMKARIQEMSYEERRVWLVKLVRLAFLNKLKQVKEIKQKRRNLFLEELKEGKDKTKDYLLEKIEELKEIFDIKELDDVDEILKIQKAKSDQKFLQQKELQMKVRLRRLQRLEEIKKKEEKKRRDERTEVIREVITGKKDWENEMIRRIDGITKALTGEVAKLKDKEKWYEQVKEEIDQEKAKELEEGTKRILQERLHKEIEMEKELNRKRYNDKMKEIETWNKEKKARLWRLDQVSKFQQFLEQRYKIREDEEEQFFNKIFAKLAPDKLKTVEVNPWAVKRKVDERIRLSNRRKQMNQWLQSIISTNKKKVVQKIKLKKYLEMMETPQLNHLFKQISRIESVQNLMCVVRGRIFKSTFEGRVKHYLAKEVNSLVKRAQLDIREIDPEDRLLNIQITTINHDLFLSPGEEFVLIAQQKVSPAEPPCSERTDVLCLTEEERNQIVELVNKRRESRKVIKEKRAEEYEAYLNRQALDRAWMKYMKKAYAESIKDLDKCRPITDDQVKLELDDEETTSSEEDEDMEHENIPIFNEDRLRQILLAAERRKSKPAGNKQPLNLKPEEAMEKRKERLLRMVSEEKQDVKRYYESERPELRDLLAKERTVRRHMAKDLPEEPKYD